MKAAEFRPFGNHFEEGVGINPDNFRQEGMLDVSTGKLYKKEGKGKMRAKSFGLALAGPIAHLALSVANIAYRALKVVSFYNFWKGLGNGQPYNFKARLAETGKDLLRIVATPFAYIALELAAIEGIFSPMNGRKVYNAIEEAVYGRPLMSQLAGFDPVGHANATGMRQALLDQINARRQD